ncbi:MAG: BatA and WFA domain-containing protein [Phycisphaerales bacterium]|nr:BatA and WFA domain-containing protein [Phycisphaerales bacterium]
MSFLNLWALWIAAAVIPALVILYFLKLRRRAEPVSSTLLWKRAVQDLQVNAPFQRLRRNLLLLLQLAVLVLAILALARPIVQSQVRDEERVVILLDRSASMNVVERGGRTRLDEAKEQAVRLCKTFNRRGGSWWNLFNLAGARAQTQVMVIAFSERATIVSPFTMNTSELEAVIRNVEPTDGRTNIAEALQLAKAYMLPPTMLTPGMESTPVSAEAAARLVLVSDGRIPDLAQAVLKSGELAWLPIGQEDDNVGITAFRAQRSYERPETVNAFLTVRNFGPAAVSTDVSIYLDGRLTAVRRVELGPLSRPRGSTDPNTPQVEAPDDEAVRSGASLAFDLPVERAAVLEARLSRPDAFAVDNSAWLAMSAPRKLRVLVVTEKNALLDIVMRLLPLAEFPFVKPAEWEANAGGRFMQDDESRFDVVVFDKHQPKRLPRGNFLMLAALPPVGGITGGETVRVPSLVWWDEAHPVLRHVALDLVNVYEALTLRVPREAELLVEGTAGPVLARVAADGRQCLVLAFALEQSDWWSKQSLPIFLYNAIRFLGGIDADAQAAAVRPGDALRIPAPAGGTTQVIRPDGSRLPLAPDASGVAYFGGANRVGVYRVEPGLAGRDTFAVNLEDDEESDIAPPVGGLTMGGARPVERIDAISTATPEVWRWFVGAALLLVLIEWWVYNRRVMV